MRIRTLIFEKKMIDRKIVELKNIMSYDTSDVIAQELVAQFELLQSKKININILNNQVKINLAGKDVTVSTVIILRDTAKNKIDILTGLINNNECKLDKIELMKQRDSIYEEYVLLSNEINLSDLNTKIGE